MSSNSERKDRARQGRRQQRNVKISSKMYGSVRKCSKYKTNVLTLCYLTDSQHMFYPSVAEQ